jgi:hypothetical protein
VIDPGEDEEAVGTTANNSAAGAVEKPAGADLTENGELGD